VHVIYICQILIWCARTLLKSEGEGARDGRDNEAWSSFTFKTKIFLKFFITSNLSICMKH